MSNFKIVVLASGEGTNFESLTKAVKDKKLSAEITALITNNPQARVIEKARSKNIQVEIINPKDFESEADWDQKLSTTLKSINPSLIVLAGFLRKIGPQTLTQFKNKIINSHPSLLPQYGGPGMFGKKIHRAVIEAKEKATGITIHVVDEEIDNGKILAQTKIPIQPQDTAELLESRLKEVENIFYPQVIEKIIKKEISCD